MLKATADHRKALIVFSKEHRWASHLVGKLSHQYHVISIIAAPIFINGGTVAVEKKINELITNNDIDLVFFDTEFFPIIDSLVINATPKGVLRVLLAFDDALQHEINLQHALSCHAVLTADPVSAYRFQQRNIPSHLICLEGSTTLYYPAAEGASPHHDVLFFGNPRRGDRQKWLSYLAENGVNVFIPQNDLSFEELAEQIRSSRIVLNFSKVGSAPYSPMTAEASAPYIYFKGRIIEAGLSGVPCLSEAFPGMEEMFGDATLASFSTPAECLQLIRNLLADESQRLSLGKALHEHCIKRYADIPQSVAIAKFLANRINRQPAESPASVAYCANLLSRKIFRLLPQSPVLAGKEILRLVSRRLVGRSIQKNIIIVTFATIVSVVGVINHLLRSRYMTSVSLPKQSEKN